MSDIINPLLQWLNAHPQAAGFVTFIISAIESIAIIGTIIPGSILMTAVGTLAGAGVIPLWSTIIWAILGAIVGDGISYWLGYYFKERIHDVWPFKKYPYILATGERFFQRHGTKSVLIGRFVGPVRALIPLVAGTFGMSPWRFTIANIISAIGWAPAYMLPGIILGAASLELPPDLAVHAILMALLVILFVVGCWWILQKIFHLVGNKINQLISHFWARLQTSSRFNIFTKTLSHHNPQKTYEQLLLVFYFMLTFLGLTYLATYIFYHPSNTLILNQAPFYLFRSLRTPLGDNIFLALSFLGDKYVLLPVSLALLGWLTFKKKWRTAGHVLAFIFLCMASIKGLKTLVHSSRPWGIIGPLESFSFPSGHTTLAVAFYMGITLFLAHLFEIKHRRFLYFIAISLIVAVSLSRLYLGVHWFTDVIAGWLLGAAILIVITLSYNRRQENHIRPQSLLSVTLIALCIAYSVNVFLYFNTLKQKTALLSWPIYTISQANWWDIDDPHFPLNRINRFGLHGQIFNVQWIGELQDIKHILLKNNWEEAPENDWISILHRLSNIQSTEHLPLVSPLHLDEDPVLVLIKYIQNDTKLIVLRFWQPNIKIQSSSLPLWVGSVEFIPPTYSWLFNKKHPVFSLTPQLLFESLPAGYNIKETSIEVRQHRKKRQLPIILIKPKIKRD